MHNAGIIGIVVLISYAAPFMHACMHVRESTWSKGSHFLVLKVCILQTNQVAEAWSHDIGVRTPVHSAYAHGTEVAVIFHFTTPELPIIAL